MCLLPNRRPLCIALVEFISEYFSPPSFLPPFFSISLPYLSLSSASHPKSLYSSLIFNLTKHISLPIWVQNTVGLAKNSIRWYGKTQRNFLANAILFLIFLKVPHTQYWVNLQIIFISSNALPIPYGYFQTCKISTDKVKTV